MADDMRDRKSALCNLKILDFTTLLPGPYATLMLADLGAEVVKIGSKSKLDLVYEMGEKDKELGLNANQLWLNRNKKTVSLNLKKSESIEIVKKMIMEYDIVIEQFRPGVMERLGLSYDVLSKINPKLIYCSVSSYGNTGPLKDVAGHDINFLAKSGLLSISGRKNYGPSLMGTQLGDIAGGALHAVIGILAAVNYRSMTGNGQYIDISMLDTIIPMNSFEGADYLLNGGKKTREGFELNGAGIYDIYETSDKEYLAIGSLEPKFLKALATAVDMPELIDAGATPKDNGALKNRFRQLIGSKTMSYWLKKFDRLDACIEKVLDFEEAFENDPQIKERAMIVEVDSGEKKVRQFAMPIKLSESKVEYRHTGKEIGYDTFDVLKKYGCSEGELEKLAFDGVFD